MPRAFQIGGSHADLHAAQSHPGGNRRVARRLPADDQPRDNRDNPAYPRSGARIRPGCRRPGPRCPVHPGRHAAPVLVMGRAQGTVLGKAQGHRNERPGRLHDLRQARMDLRSDRRKPPRQLQPGRIRSTTDDELEELDRDKGYIGNNMITPYRKPAGGELLDWQKEYNTQVNKIRWMIEQVISHFKNWTIMHTDYRRPLKTFETTISAVVGLHFYRTA